MRILFSVAFLFLFSFSYAQDIRDIVRISETQVFGSARFEGMAGSFGALGADLSSSSINPAGYGRYSSSAFGFSFQNSIINSKTTFNGTVTDNKINSFKLNNLGVVFCNDVSTRNKGFIYNQLGFSFNRVQDFKNNYSYKGEQFYSLLDNFASNAYGLTPAEIYDYLPFSSALAYDTYAINPDPNDPKGYVPDIGNGNVYHTRTIENIGGISEYNFNFSSNYMNKLYIGGNIGLRSIKYQEDYLHNEQILVVKDSLQSFDYEYHLKTKGSGTNIKIGVIYVATYQLRLGLSAHSPIFYKLTDTYSSDMTSTFTNSRLEIAKEYKPSGEYKYRLSSPAKLVGSAAYIFGTRGAINVDAELINYSWGKLKSTTDSNYVKYDFKSENTEARAQLRTVLNIRVGGELVFNSQYFIRGGFAIYPSAYNQKLNPTKSLQVFSGGAGIHWKRSSFDFALKVEHRNFNYYAFNESLAVVNTLKNSLIFNYSLNF